MQPLVTQAVKTTIIDDWLRDLSKDEIAAKHGVSAGTVTDIILEWRAFGGKLS
jgi:transposase